MTEGPRLSRPPAPRLSEIEGVESESAATAADIMYSHRLALMIQTSRPATSGPDIMHSHMGS